MRVGESNPLPRQVRLTAHIDATEGVVEPFLAHRVDDFKKLANDPATNIEGAVKVLRGGSTATSKMIKGVANLAAHLALPVAGFMVGGPIGAALGLAVDAGLFVVGVTRSGLGNVASSLKHKENVPEGDWKGQQVTRFGQDQTESLAREEQPDLSRDGLQSFVADNLRPGQTNVVYLSGHGLGGHQTAGLPTARVAEALLGASSKTGVKPDFLVLESCLQGNLEALSSLTGTARIAVVSEEVLPAEESSHGLPLKEMLTSLAAGSTPEEAARALVEAARQNDVSTLAAVDLDKFAKARESLQTLGAALAIEVVGGKKESIKKAMDDSLTMPNMALLPLERLLLNQTDLGNFLTNLEKTAALSEPSREAARHSRELFEQSLLGSTRSKEYEQASGLSFQDSTGLFDKVKDTMTSHSESGLPENWQTFIQLMS